MIKYGLLFGSLLVAGLLFAGGVEKGILPLSVVSVIWLAIGGFIVFMSAKER